MVLRRLARRQPYGVYYFAMPCGEVVSVPVNKVSAIHRVVLQ